MTEHMVIEKMAEAGASLIYAYKSAVLFMGEDMALAHIVKLIKSVIRHEMISATDILEAIRVVEMVDNDVLHG